MAIFYMRHIVMETQIHIVHMGLIVFLLSLLLFLLMVERLLVLRLLLGLFKIMKKLQLLELKHLERELCKTYSHFLMVQH